MRIYFVGDNLQDMEFGAAFTNIGDATLFSIEDDAPIGFIDVDPKTIQYLKE
jgi:homoaconitase/3-isopropylmalate dehydratase large subunit